MFAQMKAFFLFHVFACFKPGRINVTVQSVVNQWARAGALSLGLQFEKISVNHSLLVTPTLALPVHQKMGLEDYKIIRCVGKGSFGKVYLCRHIRVSSSCCVTRFTLFLPASSFSN